MGIDKKGVSIPITFRFKEHIDPELFLKELNDDLPEELKGKVKFRRQ